jgi:predicted RNA methylase
MNKHRKVFTVDVSHTTNADIEYFRQKFANTLIHNPPAAERARRQLELIENAAAVDHKLNKEN